MSLRKDIIRLAYNNPGPVRDALLPLLGRHSGEGISTASQRTARLDSRFIERYLDRISASWYRTPDGAYEIEAPVHVVLYWDDSDAGNEGWAYRFREGRGDSGALDTPRDLSVLFR